MGPLLHWLIVMPSSNQGLQTLPRPQVSSRECKSYFQRRIFPRKQSPALPQHHLQHQQDQSGRNGGHSVGGQAYQCIKLVSSWWLTSVSSSLGFMHSPLARTGQSGCWQTLKSLFSFLFIASKNFLIFAYLPLPLNGPSLLQTSICSVSMRLFTCEKLPTWRNLDFANQKWFGYLWPFWRIIHKDKFWRVLKALKFHLCDQIVPNSLISFVKIFQPQIVAECSSQ